MFHTRRRPRTRHNHRSQPVLRRVRERPVSPLPALGGLAPVEVSYDERSKEVELGLAPSGPDLVLVQQRIPVFALKGGVIVSVSDDAPGGREVYIDHRCGYSSAYRGLTQTIVKPTRRGRKVVRTGELIGYICALESEPPRTLRFTLFEHMTRGVPAFPLAIDPRMVLSMCALQSTERAPVALLAAAA